MKYDRDVKYDRDTVVCLMGGVIGAAILCLPFYSWIFDRGWDWAEGFPLGYLALGLDYLKIFFHELGHTAFGWFYGYGTLPSFDLQNGGGMAYQLTPQEPVILAGVYAAMAYGLYACRGCRLLQAAIVLLFLFQVVTAYSADWREAVITFMGPAAEPLTGGIFLYRALTNRVTRVTGERLAHAVCGFGLIFRTLLDSDGLLHSVSYRLSYYNQKGEHGFGDFDRVANALTISFHSVVVAWIGLSLIALIVPFLFYYFDKREPVTGP